LSKKRILVILIVLVFLPILFFGIYEITSFNQSINLINQIYDAKLNSVLFTINQHFLDRTNNLSSNLSAHLTENPDSPQICVETFYKRTTNNITVFLCRIFKYESC